MVVRFLHSGLSVTALALISGSLVSLAEARECDRFVYNTELVDDVTYCASSVLPRSRSITYQPGNLEGYDGEGADKAWCEGVRGPGVGEWVEFSTRPGTTIRKFELMNGYQKSQRSFYDNARAREIAVETDSGFRKTFLLADRFGIQTIELGKWYDVKRLKITIRSVYPGSKYDDLCLSNLSINFEDIREFEWQDLQRSETMSIPEPQRVPRLQ
ncbi:NADase-type glycan-binding domain-containing protein [uncultured Cohaesibacter sp.]|uniref:NADase-type glycan-binding domain-containing protein n=1 Tax=uncultured Cohaesibacter sp. TaxID=1002546 RepID=UPI0029C87DFF|nr:hypothetical protein [uncultured Cohaesibacter sp.]